MGSINITRQFSIMLLIILFILSSLSPIILQGLNIYNMFAANLQAIIALFLLGIYGLTYKQLYLPNNVRYLVVILLATYLLSMAFNFFITPDLISISLKEYARLISLFLVPLAIINMLNNKKISVNNIISAYLFVITTNFVLSIIDLLYVNKIINLGFMGKFHQNETLMAYLRMGDIPIIYQKSAGFFHETQSFALVVFICFLIQDVLSKHRLIPKLNGILLLSIQALILFLFSKIVTCAFLLYKIIRSSLRPGLKYLLYASIFYGTYLLLQHEINDISIYGLTELGSMRERLYHLSTIINLYSNNAFAFVFGIGPRLYGTYLMSINPNPVWNVDSNPLSIAAILADAGSIAFIAYLCVNYFVYRSLKTVDFKTAYFILFFANTLIPQYLSCHYFIGLFLIIYFDENLGGHVPGIKSGLVRS